MFIKKSSQSALTGAAVSPGNTCRQGNRQNSSVWVSDEKKEKWQPWRGKRGKRKKEVGWMVNDGNRDRKRQICHLAEVYDPSYILTVTWWSVSSLAQVWQASLQPPQLFQLNPNLFTTYQNHVSPECASTDTHHTHSIWKRGYRN